MTVGEASSVISSTLLGFTRFLTNTLDNVNAFSDTNILALLNLSYRSTQSYLLSQIMYDWKENTINGSGTGLINLVAGTNKYAFPAGLLTIDRIEINYTGATNTWVEVNPVKLEAMGTAISNTSGNVGVKYSKNNPHYWIRDGYIYIDPMIDQSVTGGLKIWCTTLITDLVLDVGATTSAPVFSAPFHKILAYETAEEWLRQKGLSSVECERKKNELKLEIIAFYMARTADIQPSLKAKKRNMK